MPEEFWSNVAVSANGCWLWSGYTVHNGYGMFYLNGKLQMAHRLSYVAFIGPIPTELELDHVKSRGCNNRNCVYPGHLEPVTRRENVARGTSPVAENMAKTVCSRGHQLEPPRKGPRPCPICHVERAREQRRIILRAAYSLGLNRPQYVAIYGWSVIKAREILNETIERSTT